MQFKLLGLNFTVQRTGWFTFAENKGNQEKKNEKAFSFSGQHTSIMTRKLSNIHP